MSCRRFVALAVIAFLLSGFGAPSGGAYTQSGFGVGIANGVPMGHEWVTRMAAIELLGYVPASVPDLPDPNDPRKTPIPWTQGLARNLDISSAGAQAEVRRIKGQPWSDCNFSPGIIPYCSRYKPVHDAIIGERWVDIAGYNALTSRSCWDAVAQEPAEVQYDHFMRRYDDGDATGGVTAAQTSQQRFVAYFVAAAMAPSTIMDVYDGGAQLSTAVDVDRNYFLFGRAVHLFEDSFSSEHTVRISTDNYVRVRQVKSYLCATGSEQHSHSMAAVFNYSSGDVVWRPGTGLDPSWNAYKASNMKNTPPGGAGRDPGNGAALVAVEATKDLWAAFIRTMGTPVGQRLSVARAEATTLVNNWLSYDQQEVQAWYNTTSNRDATYVLAQGQSGPGKTQQACMAGLDVGTDDQMTYVRQLQATQRQCLYNAVPWAGYSDLFDTQERIWFAWRWLNGPTSPLSDPPSGWQIPNLPADSGVRVQIKSAANQQYLSAPDGIQPDAWVYAKAGSTPLDFILVGPKNNGVFRLTQAPLLFLSYRLVDGAVKLYAPGWKIDPTNYALAPAGAAWSIKNIAFNQYMWLSSSSQSPYISGTGNPSNTNSQWYIDGLMPPMGNMDAAIQTMTGNNLTIVNGGGLGEDANRLPIHTDAAVASIWETFTVVWLDSTFTHFALRTSDGRHYVTAVNGGGIGGPNDYTKPVHTDATWVGSWEKLRLNFLAGDKVTIQVPNGRFLTAVNGGGIGGDNPIDTDRTEVGPWEVFTLVRY